MSVETIALQEGLKGGALMQLIPYSLLPNGGRGAFRNAYLLSTTLGSPLKPSDEKPYSGGDDHLKGVAFVLIPSTQTIFALTGCCWEAISDEYCCDESKNLLSNAKLPSTGSSLSDWDIPYWDTMVKRWVTHLESNLLVIDLYLEAMKEIIKPIFKD